MYLHIHRDPESSCTRVVTRMCQVCGVYMLTPPEPDAYARPLQRVCSSRVTLKYVTLTNPNPIMFAHAPRPRKSSCTHVVTRMCRVCGVYMLTLLEPDAYARPFCSARLQLTRNPKIRKLTLTLTGLSGQSQCGIRSCILI